jgi:signal transduction histidine kinase
LWYAIVLLTAVLVVGTWAYSEIQERAAGGDQDIEEASEGPLAELAEMLLFGALPALLVGVVGGVIVTRRALRPLTGLIDALESTRVENLAVSVPRSGSGDEVDRLTQVFNALKARLAEAFSQTREFTLHASHELKTPVTIIHGTLERMLSPDATVAGMQERCSALIEEVQRLSNIVTQLAFLAQADSGQQPMQVTSVPLHELVSEAAEDASLLASATRVQVSVETLEECQLRADRMRLRQLLLIIMDNAVKHNVQDGHVHVALHRRGTTAELRVINSGPELAPADRARVFERFFRGENARANQLEGSGLGLSIAQHIVRAHGGRIELISAGVSSHECLVVLPL